MSRDLERPEPDAIFDEATVSSFMNLPVWKAIEALWASQQTLVTGLLIEGRGPEDVEFFRGVLNQLSYNMNLKQILMEGNNVSNNNT